MSSNGKSNLTSPFDQMLEENRRQLDHLYRSPAPGRSSAPHGARREAPPKAVPSAAPLAGSADGVAFTVRSDRSGETGGDSGNAA